ncbi:MAG: PD40 domain-containing protein [Myxococcales bacterium]|nr:PD40 domain-containing protein [Myxococcales bacterium]
MLLPPAPRRHPWLILALAGACAGDEATPLADAADAATPLADAADGMPPVDAPTPLDAGPRCAPTAPWATPRPLLWVNTPDNELHARLSADELTLYGRIDSVRLTIATRSDRMSNFPVPAPLDLGQSTESFTSPTVTGDGSTLYFIAGVGTDPRIWRARRASPTTPFVDVGPVDELASVANVGSVYVLPDESALYFSSTSFVGPIWRAARGSSGTFAAPVEVAGVAGQTPVVSGDELTIVFATRLTTSNDSHVWMGTRPTTTVPFGSIAQVSAVDAPGLHFPSWISPDDCRLYLYSNRSGGSGGFDIYVADRTP